MRQIGSLKCIEVNRSENINPSAKRQDEYYIILFHGFGADAYDLQTLSDVMIPDAPVTWLFPQGVETVPIGPGWTGRAWWPLTMNDIEGDYSEAIPPQLPKLREMIFNAIAQLKVPWNRIVLGGFSQGAMLATDLYLNAAETPAGLMILSGTLINKSSWTELAKKRKDQKFFMCHGDQDSILPIRNASRLETLLTLGGMKGSLFTFHGAHEIPVPAIQKANLYLDSIIKK